MSNSPTLLDGGFSTALEELGNTLNTSLWSGELLKSHPDQVRAAHKLFAEAGAEILITSSHQITFTYIASGIPSIFLLNLEIGRSNL
jgi:homocysteine S-methyltransferase